MQPAEKPPPVGINPEPRPEHAWLRRLIGEWTTEGDTGGGGPSRMTITPIGELWIRADGDGTMPDGVQAETLMVLGFDPRINQFVGTWVGSMMTYMWVYEGELDEAGAVLTLHTQGPDFETEDGVARYRDIIEIVDESAFVFRAVMQAEDGTWKELMSTRYGRTQ
jgi:hypothetical protein